MAWPDIRTGTGEVVKNLKLLWAASEKYFGCYGFRKFKKLFKKLIKNLKKKKNHDNESFRVLGFEVIFRYSTIPLFHRSILAAFRVAPRPRGFLYYCSLVEPLLEYS